MEFERVSDKKRQQFIVQAILDAAPHGSQVLDIGCGNGIIAKAVADKGFRVKAVDVSAKTIETAKQVSAHPNVEYEVLPEGAMPVAPGRYHAIICSEVLEHLSDPAPLLKSLRKSLADTGMLLVTVPNGYGPRELLVTRPVQRLQAGDGWAARMVGRLKQQMGYTGTTAQSSADDLRHMHFFSIRTLKILALTNGFQITQIKPTNFIEQVFPFSLVARNSTWLQKWDNSLADTLPLACTSGFMTVWKKD